MRKLASLVIVAAMLAACNKPVEQSAASPAAAQSAAATSAATPPATQLPAGHPEVPATSAAPVPAPAGQLTGKVLETMNAAGYTYLKLATAKGEQWAAVRETTVKTGATVTVDAQMTMENFESKTLKRTFDRIVFGAMAGPGGSTPAPATTSAPASMAMGSASQHMKPPDIGSVNVPKAEGGKSVAELWSERGALKGKEIVVRGKVVKFLGGIMGTNWMHLQDGTGSAAKGDNDITITTNDRVSVGDVVTMKGTLNTDKDFGAGYRYEVIVEKASVVK